KRVQGIRRMTLIAYHSCQNNLVPIDQIGNLFPQRTTICTGNYIGSTGEAKYRGIEPPGIGYVRRVLPVSKDNFGWQPVACIADVFFYPIRRQSQATQDTKEAIRM